MSLALVMLGGCASTTPHEVTDARQAYEAARASEARQYAEPRLENAASALERAEESYRREGNTPDTRDLASIAEGLSRLAQAEAGAERATREARASEQRLEVAEARAKQKTMDALGRTREELAAAESARERAEARLESAEVERARAEREAQEAREMLGRVGEVREEARGTVVTVPGTVLFSSGEAAISQTAESRLMELASALARVPRQHIIIEGYTDSRGSSRLNQRLSKARAEAVRKFLVDQGVDAGRIEARGMGASAPVADNKTAEGRAQNRRVEVVIEPLRAS